MNGPGALSAEDAVRGLSLASGESYRLVRRLAGGETGAHEVVGPAGARLVLKWELDPTAQTSRRRAVGLTRRLQTLAHWPVPDQYVIDGDGVMFVLQTFADGDPIEYLSHHLVDRLLDLHEGRRGLAQADDDADWPRHLLETLTVGGSGYCLHAPLHQFDDRTASLVARIEDWSRRLDPDQFRANDIVHWDFHPGNLLQVDGELTAVVDNDFVTVGDGAFDLIALALAAAPLPCGHGVGDRLMAAAFEDLDDARRRSYVSHLLIRYLDWAIRKQRTPEIDFWLDQAGRLLV